MSKSKIHISGCDRCGVKEQSEQEHGTVFYNWGHVWFAQKNGTIASKLATFPKYFEQMNDLCPDCMIELNEWYNKPKTGNF